MKYTLILLLGSFLLLTTSCAPLYVQNFRYEEMVRAGEYEKANKYLDKSKFYNKRRNRLLFLLEKGKLAHLAGQYSRSNQYFNEADLLIEDQQVQLGSEALAFVTNDMQRPYQAEDFEAVTIHFYKAGNYLMLRANSEALVEARRMNLRLQALDDKFPDHKNRYDGDALGHVLMGVVYEASGDYNNAFIAYRNAANLFEEGDSYMGTPIPAQLQKDVLRTAYLSGFQSDVRFYERQFGMNYQHRPSEGGHLVLFWENALGPVKSEWSVNFTIVDDDSDKGRYVVVNNDLGLAFPLDFDKDDEEEDDDGVGIEDIQLLRVAFPKYVLRPDRYVHATLVGNGQKVSLHPLEDYDYIARRSLQDRFMREAARGMGRLVTKKLAELSLKEENETAGAVLGLLNVITEKADTRNWQTLPATVSYIRVPLRSGENTFTLQLRDQTGRQIEETFTVNGWGGLQVRNIHSIPALRGWSPNDYYNSLVDDNPPHWWRGY